MFDSIVLLSENELLRQRVVELRVALEDLVKQCERWEDTDCMDMTVVGAAQDVLDHKLKWEGST